MKNNDLHSINEIVEGIGAKDLDRRLIEDDSLCYWYVCTLLLNDAHFIHSTPLCCGYTFDCPDYLSQGEVYEIE